MSISTQHAAGLMTIAMAVALMTAPAAYTRPDDTGLLGLSVAGSAGSFAGTTIAMPVSGAGEHAVKLHKSAPRKHAGS